MPKVSELMKLIEELRAEVKELKEAQKPKAPEPVPEPPKASEQPPKQKGKYAGKTAEEKKALLKENWNEKKAIYNAKKREKRAEKGLKTRGRKKKDVVVAVPEEQVPEQPPRLREIFGSVVKCPIDPDTWVHKHTKKWEDLGDNAKNSYPNLAKLALRNAGYTPPDTKDPITISDYCLTTPIDLWKVLTEATDPKYSVHQRNGYSKGLLGVLNAKMRKSLESKDPQTHKLCVWTTIIHLMNANAKKDTTATHEGQKQSAVAEANTIEWGHWLNKSIDFVKNEKNRRDAMIVAVYSLIPPIRRNWFNMEIVTEEPAKDDKRNSIIINEKEVITFWGDFKNKASFKTELPLKIPIENVALCGLLRDYKKTLKTKWLFPNSDKKNATHIPRDAFGKLIGDIGEKLVGKRFTVNRMRASFITHFHTVNAKPTVVEMRAVMRQLHQTNLSVHLSYAKAEAKWNKAVEDIKASAENND